MSLAGEVTAIPKKIWIPLVTLVVLVLAAALALPRLVDVNRHRDLIQRKASEALGRDVRLGEMRLSLLPVLGVRVDDVIVAALPAEGGGELLSAESLRIGARLMPLLRKRLEVTSIVVQQPRATLERRADGTWNVQPATGPAAEAEPATRSGASALRVGRLTLTDGVLVFRDHAGEGEIPTETTLTEIDLELEDLSWDRPFSFALSCLVGELSDARVRLEGRAGPLAALPDGFETQGSLELSGARARLAGPDGKTRSIPLEMTARYDIEARRGGGELEVRSLTIETGGNTLSFEGSVREEGDARRVDLKLQPASMPATDLAGLLTLVAGELPVSFGSKTPVEFEGRVHGLIGEGHEPEIEGSARLREFTFRHPAMREPIERVRADVRLRGERVEIEGLHGVIGASDVGGRIELDGFATPALSFDLHSEKADMGELFSFLVSEEDGGGEGEGEPAVDVKLDGRLRIDQGSFDTLDFANLDMQMNWRTGVVTLDPLHVGLYEGTFAGRVVGDLREAAPIWEVEGEAANVNVDAFLADNADAGGLISGRFTGRVATRATGADYEAIVRGLTGSGVANVKEGRVGRLDVLKTLSRVSGVFGETTLRGFSAQLATEGTDFESLSTDVGLDGGKMRFDKLVLAAPVFRLTGQGVVDLVSTDLQGQFRLVLSREISEAMRREKSRAAELFWNSKSGQVEMPFSLSGPFDEPTPGIDFKSVGEAAVKDRVNERLRETLGDKLGLGRQKAAPQQAPAPVAPSASVAPGEARELPTGLAVEIRRTRWSGPVLARDLDIDGVVRGESLEHVELMVLDANGNEIRRIERLKDVEAFLSAAADRAALAEIPWKAEIDGKRLVLAKFPVRVKVTAYDTDGRTAEASTAVDR